MSNKEIRALMQEKIISIDDIAAALKVTKRTANRRIDGTFVKYVHDIFPLSKLFGMKPSEFVSNVLHLS